MLLRKLTVPTVPFLTEGDLIAFPEGLAIRFHFQLLPVKGSSMDHQGRFWDQLISEQSIDMVLGFSALVW